MTELSIPWRPRVIMPGRTFRLPVTTDPGVIKLDAAGFKVIDRRWAEREKAWYFYLRSPEVSGDYTLSAGCGGKTASAVIQVRSLDELRQPHAYNGATWPRRWPLGKMLESAKKAQTLQDTPQRITVSDEQIHWWMNQSDESVWHQLPYPEWPQAHFVNVHQGCPHCGTAVFKYSGFYPWTRNHYPGDFRSTCPACETVFPSNNFQQGDFTSGETPDDGYGYFDQDGHVYLFTATYHRDQVMRFDNQIQQLTSELRNKTFNEAIARKLTIMLLRYATDILYLAAVPQFRYGPSRGEEEPWPWGQPDWADEADPVAALFAKGMRRYSIDVPYISETLSLAYDTVWPFIRQDKELVDRAQALGLSVQTSGEIVLLIEEMLAAQLHCIMDRGARSNLPRESMGALTILRALDRPDAQEVMDWLYDTGPDRMRVFGINNFFPDGSPFEATGNYNGIHTNGLFTLEYHLRHLRRRHPFVYPESKYPSLVDDPRAARVARQPHEITMIGKSWFQFGDGSAPGSKALHGKAAGRETSLQLQDTVIHPRLVAETMARAAEYTSDPVVREILAAEQANTPRHIGTTIHDGVGIGILRTEEIPERAALGIVYGDTSNHRHMDLLDVQLFAHGRPFLTDLGYPQSWATRHRWEGHWATHNTLWGVISGVDPGDIAGRGRLVRNLFTEGIQVFEVAGERWTADADHHRWDKQDVSYRRLIALVETDGDGVAVVDFSRIRGGTEHWRICRGLHGEFATGDLTFTPQPGTVASPDGIRGDVSALAYPDYAGLACMDDVAVTTAGTAWHGVWTSTEEAGVCLDMHQVAVSDETTLLTARSTALMGTPEESDYNFRTLLWRRHPAATDEVSRIDLVMEPRVGDSVLAEVQPVAVASGPDTGMGVTVRTRAGKEITLYWAPDIQHDQETIFQDGTVLHGPLAVVVDRKVTTTGTSKILYKGQGYSDSSPITGQITGLDRQARTIEVRGLSNIMAGDRIRINPSGRGHNYGIEAVEEVGHAQCRLTLDVTSLIGRSPVNRVDADHIELDMNILARTGNLTETRLQTEKDGSWAPIDNAFNGMHGQNMTLLQINDRSNFGDLRPGDWVQIVDYVVGDEVVFEPTVTGS